MARESNLELFAPNSRKAMIAALMQRAGQPNPSLGGSIGHALALGLMGLYEGQDEKAALDTKLALANDPALGGAPTVQPMGNVGTPNASAEAPKPIETVKPTGKGFAFPDRAYSADEFNPLDAQVAKPSELAAALSDKMGPKDLDVAARTVIGEAGGYNPIDKQNVAAVLLNRSNLAGTSPATEALKPNQFEPWNTAAGRARMNVPQDSPSYQDATRAVYMATQADPTGGATHFYSPNAQASLGRQPPKWDDGSGTDIGPHRFFSQPYAGQQATAFAPQPSAPSVPSAITQGPQVAQAGGQGAPYPVPPVSDPRIPELLRRANDPNLPRAAREFYATQVIQLRSQQPKTTDEMTEYDLYRRQGGNLSFFDYKSGLKKAGATNVTVPIDQRGELQFDKKASDIRAEQYGEMWKAGQGARQGVSDMKTLGTLFANIGTGKVAEAKAIIGPYADALGIKVEGLSDIQAADAILNRVAPSLRIPGTGAQSDVEFRSFIKSMGSIGNTPEGNALINRTMTTMFENRVRAGEIAGQALEKQITRAEADKMLRELPDPMQEWRSYQKKSGGTSGGSPSLQQIEDEILRRRGRR